MHWTKKGMIIAPNGDHDWMVTHAMLPFAERRDGDVYRVYFSGRDQHNRSLAGYAEIDLKDPFNVLRFSPQPVLGLGSLGCFDDNGVTPSWVVDCEGQLQSSAGGAEQLVDGVLSFGCVEIGEGEPGEQDVVLFAEQGGG